MKLRRISGVAAALLWTVCSGPAAGDDPPPENGDAVSPTGADDPEVEEIVITGSPETSAGPGVQGISRDEVVRRGARSLADVLAVPAALQSITGGRGERTLTLRGFDQRQTLLLVDGTPFLIPYDGQVGLDMIPAEMIDHVTVVKGPGSVLFGPTGMGGAVNVVTRRPGSRPSLQATFEADGEGSFDLSSVASFRAGPAGFLLGGAWQNSPGFRLSSSYRPTFLEDGGRRNNSYRRNSNFFANLDWNVTPGQRLTLGGFFLSTAKGIPPSTLSSQARFWRLTDWTAAGISVGSEARFDCGLYTDAVFFARGFDNLIDAYDDDGYLTQDNPSRSFHSWYHDRIYGGRLRARLGIESTPLGEIILRLWSSAQADTHAEDWASGNGLRVTRGLLTVSPEAEILPGPRLALTASLQAEFEFPGDTQQEKATTQAEANPLISLGYEPMPGLWLRITVARRSRFPTLKERFSSSLGLTQPNPGLGPENAWHFGLDGSFEASRRVRLQAAFFDAEVSGLIGKTPIGNGLEQMQNLGRSRILGAELALAADPWTWLTVSAGYAYLFARRTDLDPPGDRLADRPEHKLSLEIIAEPVPDLELSTVFQLAGPTPFQHPDTMRWGELGVYPRWDARVAYHIDCQSSMWIRASNVLDLDYQTRLGFPEPGFEVALGFRSGLSW
jgi:iron complex outermembrane receptor protein